MCEDPRARSANAGRAWSGTGAAPLFLDAKDPRWEPLLDEVEKLCGKLVKNVDEKNWETKLAIGPIEQFKRQLRPYLLSFIRGSARAIVEAGDVHGALDVWRQLADSQRETHVMALREKAYGPRKAM